MLDLTLKVNKIIIKMNALIRDNSNLRGNFKLKDQKRIK